MPKGPYGLEEIKKFQEYLYTLDPPFQIKDVYDQTVKPLYTGPIKTDKDHILYLLKADYHYDCLITLSGFFNRSYWYDDCDKAFRVKHTEPKKKGKERKGKGRKERKEKGKAGKERKEKGRKGRERQGRKGKEGKEGKGKEGKVSNNGPNGESPNT